MRKTLYRTSHALIVLTSFAPNVRIVKGMEYITC
jgi:hypothetical protein